MGSTDVINLVPAKSLGVVKNSTTGGTNDNIASGGACVIESVGPIVVNATGTGTNGIDVTGESKKFNSGPPGLTSLSLYTEGHNIVATTHERAIIGKELLKHIVTDDAMSTICDNPK